ncbi:putative ribonuclease H-like domain-containing protein [Tanacetum coccineum]
MNSVRTMTNLSKLAHSTVKWPIHKNTIFKNSNFNQRVNIVKDKNINTVRPKAVVNAARPKAVVKDVKRNNVNAVKASTCWVWKPKTKVLDHVPKHSSASITLKKFDYVDAQDYEEINGGYVSFGGNPKGGKIIGRALGFMRPFGCPVIILNTIDHLGKFDGKTDEGFFVGYSINSKAFRVFNSRNRIVEENMHVQFSEDTPDIARSGPNWLFDIDALTKSMNYKPVVAGNQSNGNAGTKACDDAGKARMETVPGKDCILLPLWTADPSFSQSSKSSPDAGFKPSGDYEKKVHDDQEKEDNVNSTNNVNTTSSSVNAVGIEVNVVGAKTSIKLPVDPNMPAFKDIVYSDDNDEDVGVEADMNNLDAFMPISPIPTTRIHKDHPVEQIIRDLNSAPQTRRMTKNLEEHGLFSSVQQRTNHKDFQNCLFACFLSQEEPKKVWTLVDLPNGRRPIGTKWVYRNKKDKRGVMIRNKARIEAIRLFLAYASFKDFMVYQMDVKSAFLYGKIEEEVYVCQPLGFEDPDFPDKVYKVQKALYGLHQAPRAWYETLSTYLLDNGFQKGKIDKTLFIRRDKDDILLVQVYVDDIIFGSTKKELCIEFEKLMHEKFHMSSMGELTFFLGLQV